MASARSAFDRLADRYDDLWTNTISGRLQREAVWRHLAPLFRAGDRILDLGCGTGEDALHLECAGVEVSAYDASPGMVSAASRRGVRAEVLTLEELDRIGGIFDGALSNFGAMNCIANLDNLRAPLARLIRPGGFLVLCVIGRFCLWETVHFVKRGELRKATRRWSGSSLSASLGFRVFYPGIRRLSGALRPYFTLVQAAGIGLCVPPSYVGGVSIKVLERCDALDGRVAHLPGLRALSDHHLLIFVRC
jgi:ubiquinone/menaquinone biosynthesis C-methylase UbiE